MLYTTYYYTVEFIIQTVRKMTCADWLPTWARYLPFRRARFSRKIAQLIWRQAKHNEEQLQKINDNFLMTLGVWEG